MPCVTPLMVGTRRRRPPRCQPGLEEPPRSWDERHLPSQGPLGLGERNAMVVPSDWRVPYFALRSLCLHGETATLATLPCPKSSSPGLCKMTVTWGKGSGKGMGMEHGVSAVRVAVPCPHPAGRTVPAQHCCSCLPYLPLPEAQATPQLLLRVPQPHNRVLAGPQALCMGVMPEQPVCPADLPPPLCSRQE